MRTLSEVVRIDNTCIIYIYIYVAVPGRKRTLFRVSRFRAIGINVCPNASFLRSQSLSSIAMHAWSYKRLRRPLWPWFQLLRMDVAKTSSRPSVDQRSRRAAKPLLSCKSVSVACKQVLLERALSFTYACLSVLIT